MNSHDHQRRATDHQPGDCPGGCEEIKSVEERLHDGSERMDRIEAKLDTTCSDIAEVLDILRLGKSFFRVVGYVGTLIKWTAAVIAPLLAIIYTVKGGGKP